jgi:hypothetical protein
MTKEERLKIYAALAAPFPEGAIERTDGRVTGRGYSTTGIKYQYIVNRLNEVLGVGAYRVTRKISVKEITTAKGRPAFDATCEIILQLGEWHDSVFVPFAEAIGDGGHSATAMADAIKGAFTNGFKKTCAFFGIGRQAYEGSLDDDNVPTAVVPELQQAPPPTRPQSPVAQSSAPARERLAAPPSDAPPAPAVAHPESQGHARLSTKQHTTLLSLGRRLGYETDEFRAEVLERYGTQLEYLQRSVASTLISDLLARVGRNGNGNGRDAGGSDQFHGRAPGQEG